MFCNLIYQMQMNWQTFIHVCSCGMPACVCVCVVCVTSTFITICVTKHASIWACILCTGVWVNAFVFYVCVDEGMCRIEPTNALRTFTCITSDTNCTAKISGQFVRIIFCITITAHGHSQDIQSEPRCQPGRIEGEAVVLLSLVPSLLLSYIFLSLFYLSFSVMLPPVTLESVKQVRGRPQCLKVEWSRDLSLFSVSNSEIEAGNLNSQIEFTAQGQVCHSQICLKT